MLCLAGKTRLRNDLLGLCVEWDVKPTHSLISYLATDVMNVISLRYICNLICQ